MFLLLNAGLPLVSNYNYYRHLCSCLNKLVTFLYQLMKRISKITINVGLYVLLCFFNSAFSQVSWKTHFEDKSVKIQYRLAECKDKINDVDFSFYVVRFENKTKSKLNVQFDSAKKNSNEELQNENYHSFILNPLQVREGKCNSMEKELKQFAKNNLDSNNTNEFQLILLNIKTYEL